VDHEAGGLVDHDHLVVLVQDRQRHGRIGSDPAGRLTVGHLDFDDVTGRHPDRARHDRRAPDDHLACGDQRARLAPADPAEE
jgi:hypothetical protein